MYRKIEAAFMIVLILTLPIYISTAFAQPDESYEYPGHTISNVKVYGDDEINGVIRASGDTLHVQAEIQGTVIAGDVMFNEVQPFDSCSTFAGVSTCVLEQAHSAARGRLPFSVSYPPDLVTGFYYIDETGPEVLSLTAATQSGERNVTFSYTVKDYYASRSTEACSGIERIEFKKDNTVVATDVLDTANCTVTRQFSFRPSGTISEEVEYCAVAYDGFGQESLEKCANVFVDSKDPVIGQASAYVNGVPTLWLKAGLASFQLGANITDDSAISEARLNSTALELVNREATCSDNVCLWTGIATSFTNTTSIDVRISAEDLFGNKATSTQTIIIQVDNTKPVITRVESQGIIDGTSYLGKGTNTLTAFITEADSGLDKSAVKADLSPIGGGLTAADSCTNLGGVWQCTWDVVAAGIAQNPTIAIIATDKAGNSADTFTAQFIVDIHDPVVTNVTILTEQGFDFYSVGDNLEVVVEIKDLGAGINAQNTFIDATGLSAVGKVTPICDFIGDSTYSCLFIIPQIVGPKSNFALILQVEDNAGNKITQTLDSITVLGVMLEQSEFWKATVGQQLPAKIDLQTTQLIEHRAYFPVRLIPKTQRIAEVLFAEIGNCDSTILAANPTVVARNGPLMNIKYPIAQQVIEEQTVDVTCQLRVISKYQNQVTQPEAVDVNVTIQFYNMPLGELSDNVLDEIDRVSNSDLIQSKFIPTMNAIFTRLKQGCRMMETLIQVMAGLSVFGASTSWMENVPVINVFYIAFFRVPEAGVSETVLVVSKVVEWGCAVASCTVLDKVLEKVCKTCSMSGLLKKMGLNVDKYEGVTDAFGMNLDSSLITAMDPQKSIIAATLQLCLPGVFYNLQKARNIDCEYVRCLRDDVPAGTPVYVCANMRTYEWCKYVTGALWEIMPYRAIWNSFVDKVASLILNPVGLGMAATGVIACWALPKAETHYACKTLKFISAVTNAASYIANFKDNWYLEPDACKDYGITGEEEEE